MGVVERQAVAAAVRRMTVADVDAAIELMDRAFADLFAKVGRPVAEADDPDAHDRVAHTVRYLTTTDPDGCWVADGPDGLAGMTVAIRRDDLWGLALLFVDPAQQGAGVGRALLERATAYGSACSLRMVMASDDARGVRAYHRLGLAIHPAVRVTGLPRGVGRSRASEVRVGRVADLALVDAVDRRLRGASRAEDVRFLLSDGASLLVAEGDGHQGFAVARPGGTVVDGHPIVLGADTVEIAADLLREVFARAEDAVELYGLTHRQRWAIDVALEAGLEVVPGAPLLMTPTIDPPASSLISGLFF